MINPSGLVVWQWEPARDMQVPYAGRAIVWQHWDRDAQGIVWVASHLCNPKDPYDLQITKAVLCDVFQDGYPTSTGVRRRGETRDAWQVTPVAMHHAPGMDGGVLIDQDGPVATTSRILVNQDIHDPARLRSVLRWALNVAGEFDPDRPRQQGWAGRYGKWQRSLFAHPSTRSSSATTAL